MRFQRSDGSTSGHQRNPSRLRTTRRAAIKQTTPRRLTRWLKLHEVGFTSALSQNLFVLEVDATDASLTNGEMQEVGATDARRRTLLMAPWKRRRRRTSLQGCTSGLTILRFFLRIPEFWLARVGGSDPSRLASASNSRVKLQSLCILSSSVDRLHGDGNEESTTSE